MCGGPTKSVVFKPTLGEVKLAGYEQPFDFKGYPLATIGGHNVGVVFNDCTWAKFDEAKMKSGASESGWANRELKVYAYTNSGEFQGRMSLKFLGNAGTWDEAKVLISTYWNRSGLCKIYKPKLKIAA